jgi:uncharacterized protein
MTEHPHPASDPDTEAFWRFCQAEELRIQRCLRCGTYRYHPRPRCPTCQSDAFEWALCAGTGTIASYTHCHPPVLPAFAAKVPYNVIVVRLDEGPYMVSNLVEHHEDPAIDMPVEVTFTWIDDNLTIPQFRPAR